MRIPNWFTLTNSLMFRVVLQDFTSVNWSIPFRVRCLRDVNLNFEARKDYIVYRFCFATDPGPELR